MMKLYMYIWRMRKIKIKINGKKKKKKETSSSQSQSHLSSCDVANGRRVLLHKESIPREYGSFSSFFLFFLSHPTAFLIFFASLTPKFSLFILYLCPKSLESLQRHSFSTFIILLLFIYFFPLNKFHIHNSHFAS